MFVVVEGDLYLYKLTTTQIVVIHRYDVVNAGYERLCLVCCLSSGEMNLLALSDYEGNIHVLDLKSINESAVE